MSVNHYTKVIMDAIHGQIHLDRHEVHVVDHPLFQRLRFVCQNDVLHYVFPSAVHTRFSHSIGAMYMAEKMFDGIVSRKGKSRLDQGEAFSGDVYGSLNYLRSVLKLAVLLHDVGHGSFSHQFELVGAVQEILSEPGHFERLWSGEDWGRYYKAVPDHIAHEHYSVRMALKILQDIDIERSGIYIQDVLSLMETTDSVPTEKFVEAAKQSWAVLTSSEQQAPEGAGVLLAGALGQIVSGQIDADKFDYMLRDSAFSGVSYGSFNFQNLINSLNLRWSESENWLGLAISEKGVPAFEDFVMGRYNLYKNVYNHKAACLYDILLKQSIQELMSNVEVKDRVIAFLTDPNEFELFTDHYFWEMFRKHSSVNKSSFSAKLLKREKLTHLVTIKNVSDEQIRSEVSGLVQVYALDREKVFVQTSKATFSKIDKQYKDIRVIRSHRDFIDVSKKHESYVSIAESTDFFEKFSDIKITHIFYNQ